jgi:putative transposase
MRIIDPATGRTYLEKRRKRFNIPDQPRELTFSCYRRLPFSNHQCTRAWFAEALHEARCTFGFELWAYVIMPEHVHLLVYPRQTPEAMPRFLQALKEPVARQAIAYLRTKAPAFLRELRVTEGKRVRHRFWQPGGGYDRNITSLEVLRAMIDYIHANPVRRGLVARAEQWEWSSARWYAGIRPVPISMDMRVLEELAADRTIKRS